MYPAGFFSLNPFLSFSISLFLFGHSTHTHTNTHTHTHTHTQNTKIEIRSKSNGIQQKRIRNVKSDGMIDWWNDAWVMSAKQLWDQVDYSSFFLFFLVAVVAVVVADLSIRKQIERICWLLFWNVWRLWIASLGSDFEHWILSVGAGSLRLARMKQSVNISNFLCVFVVFVVVVVVSVSSHQSVWLSRPIRPDLSCNSVWSSPGAGLMDADSGWMIRSESAVEDRLRKIGEVCSWFEPIRLAKFESSETLLGSLDLLAIICILPVGNVRRRRRRRRREAWGGEEGWGPNWLVAN